MLNNSNRTQYYSKLSDAYYAATTGDVLYVQALGVTGNPNLSSNVDITVKGGYECGFASQPGWTTLAGSLTISSGSVTIENIIIK